MNRSNRSSKFTTKIFYTDFQRSEIRARSGSRNFGGVSKTPLFYPHNFIYSGKTGVHHITTVFEYFILQKRYPWTAGIHRPPNPYFWFGVQGSMDRLIGSYFLIGKQEFMARRIVYVANKINKKARYFE